MPPPLGNSEKYQKQLDFSIFLYGRWEDLDRWKWVVIDVGVILDASASNSENLFFRHFRSWVGDHSAILQGAITMYSKNLTNRQTLAGFVDNYDLIYKIIQKTLGKSKKTTPQGRGRRPRLCFLDFP